MALNLTQMKPDESGIVTEICGGCGIINKLESIGIRPGKKITKVSSQLWRGPQTVKIDNIQIAIGFGMARRIFVEVENTISSDEKILESEISILKKKKEKIENRLKKINEIIKKEGGD